MAIKVKEAEDIRRRAVCTVCKKEFWISEGDWVLHEHEHPARILICPFCGNG